MANLEQQPDNNGNDGKGEAPFDIKHEIISWLLVIVVAVALSIFITKVIIIKTEIISGSMISTLKVDDKVIGNRMAYWFKDPARGDIIFFKFPDDESKIYVKRIIGLPGETVEVKDGVVYVNGEVLSENYLKEPMEQEDFGPYNVPEGRYFVMGDNRNVSVDSRYWNNTYVTRKEICAKAWLRYSPNFTVVKSAEY